MWSIACVFLVLVLKTCICNKTMPEGCFSNNVIPYLIKHGFTKNQTSIIYEVFADFHRFTCIRLVNADENLLSTNGSVVFQHVPNHFHCKAVKSVLSNGGEVIVVQLGDSCFRKQVVTHEIMHILGFNHEHQRADRNCYVFIDYVEAEVPVTAKEMAIVHERWIERFPYDKSSATHYPRSTLVKVKNKKKYAKEPESYSDEPLGSVTGELTFLDVWKILYKFCGFPHYCDVFPDICYFMDVYEEDCLVHG